MFNFKQIHDAYLECRRNKRNTIDALLFESNQEENIIQLVEALNNRSYVPTTSVCFYITKPKAREIFAAAFRDRIVHHVIYKELAHEWEKIFIDQSFACRPQKGTHKAAFVLQSYLRKVTLSGKIKACYLKMDISNFFMSINKHILFEQLCRRNPNEELKWLLEVILFHDPVTDYEMRSANIIGKMIPQHKSLFHTPENCGLPIGNLTSQFFANVYMNDLDQFVKHILKCRFYMRYVDDFIFLSDNLEQLHHWRNEAARFVNEKLLLGINENATKIDNVFNGVDFVGFIVRPFYMLCRRRVIGNCKAKLKTFRELLYFEDDSKKLWKYDLNILDQVLANVNSYLGHFKHARTKRIIMKLQVDYSFLNDYFYWDDHKLIRKYKPPKSIKNLRDQYRYFIKLFQNSLLLFQVGCYYESYGNYAEQINCLLGYKIKNNWRGFQLACGFHQRLLSKVCDDLEKQSVGYVIFRQTGKYLNSTMERVPFMRVEFVK